MQITFFQRHEITLQLSGGEEFKYVCTQIQYEGEGKYCSIEKVIL